MRVVETEAESAKKCLNDQDEEKKYYGIAQRTQR